MLDIKIIRETPEFVKQQMAALQAFDAPVDQVLALDEERRRLLTQVEELKAQRNAESKRIGQLMREGKAQRGRHAQRGHGPGRRRD